MFLAFGPFLQGAFLSLCAFVIWSFGDVLTKLAGLDGVSPFLIAELSGWGALLPILPVLFFQKKWKRLRPQRWKWQALRCLLNLAMAFVCILSFTNLPMTTVYIGLFSSPFLISLYGALFLKEHLGLRQIAAISCGFLGVVIALWGETSTASSALGNPLLGYIALPVFLLLFVANMLFLRVLGKTETTESLVALPFLARALFFLPSLWLYDAAALPFDSLLFILGAGVTSSIGFFCMSLAYKYAPVTIVSAFHYVQLVTGLIFGYLFWGDVPTVWAYAGSVLIVISGLTVSHEARRRQKDAVLANLVFEEKVKAGLP